MNNKSVDAAFLYKEVPKSVPRTAFLEQVKRTVNGQPVSEDQILMIVEQVDRHLAWEGQHHLLDLGCGNGALSARFFSQLRALDGVDFSDYLIGVAREFFQPHEGIRYHVADMVAFCETADVALAADRALIYGCIAYLSPADVFRTLIALNRRFAALQRVFIGNIPDRDKAAEFYARRNVTAYDLDDYRSSIGYWWATHTIVDCAERAGWRAEVVHMPETFYGGPFRFDLVLTRR